MAADTGGMWPQAEEHLEPPGAGRGRKNPPLEPWKGARPFQHLAFRLLPSRTERIHFCCHKPLALLQQP